MSGAKLHGGTDTPAPEVHEQQHSTVDVGALATHIAVPEALRWTNTRRGVEFELTTLNGC